MVTLNFARAFAFSATTILQSRKNDRRAILTGFEIFRERMRSLVSTKGKFLLFFKKKEGRKVYNLSSGFSYFVIYPGQ